MKFKNRSVFLDKNGYEKIKINGKSVFVHRLIYIDVHGFFPDNMVINHIDGNKRNNHISNLECVTQKENVRHAWALGLCKSRKGESHGRSKLDDMKVLTMRTLPCKSKNGRGFGFSSKDLAEKYGVSAKVLREARSGKTWRHLPLP